VVNMDGVRKRNWVLHALALAMSTAIACSWPVSSTAAPAPGQRGQASEPGTIATSLVTLCGLAVMLVVGPCGERASLYAGEAMSKKLDELGFRQGTGPVYEWADLNDPIDQSCKGIGHEHDRVLRTQAKD
jgi:hypothetical protein